MTRLVTWLVAALTLLPALGVHAQSQLNFSVLARSERSLVVIKVEPREGHKLAEDFATGLTVRTIPETELDETIDLSGRVGDLLGGVEIALPGKPNLVVDAELEFAVCDSAGVCTPLHVAFQVEVSRKPERTFSALTLRTVQPVRDPEKARERRAKLQARALEEAWLKDDLQAALDAAAERNQPILMVFTTRWCPPCNRLQAEVLVHPERSKELQGLVLLRFDADLASSWSSKTRYRVAGYPTIVLTDSQGELLWREVGYETADDFLAALHAVTRSPQGTLAELQATAEESEDASALLAVADRHRQRGDAEAALAALEQVPEGAEVDVAVRDRVAAFLALHDPDPAAGADALEGLLLHQAVEPAVPLTEQLWWWVDLAGLRGRAEDETGVALAWERANAAAEQLLSGAPGEQAAIEAWQVIGIAALGQGDEARATEAWSEVADRLLEQLGGTELGMETIRASRGPVMSLISALSRAGRADEARMVADRAVDTFPKEDTFYLVRARAERRLGGVSEAALADASTATRLAQGDSRLRAADLWTEMLVEAERDEEAAVALREVLDGLALPEDPDIRTHRYAGALQARLDQLEAPPEGDAGEPDETP